MKYKILKKAIRINKYNTENNIFTINLSLLSNKVEVLSYNTTINPANTNLYTNIEYSILKFKSTEEYINAIKKIEDADIVVSSSSILSYEYNLINNLSNIKYFQPFYPEVSDNFYSSGFITRYISKFLNHNYLIEISLDDYISIQNKNENFHFEAYDITTVNWKLTGTREEVLEANTKELNRLKTIFGDFNTFYGLNEFDSGPFYLTIYDEIPNLYTIGNELIYEDVLSNYSGYYHYIKGKLWSGVTDAFGPNRYLIEETVKDLGSDDVGQDIISDVSNLLNSIDGELKKYPDALDKLEDELNGLADEFGSNLQNAFNEFLKGSDLEDIFNESMKDVDDLQKDPNKQAEIEQRYNDKLDKLPLSEDDKKKVKKKGPKLPNIKIPNVHIGRKPHEEGKDHNYELGF